MLEHNKISKMKIALFVPNLRLGGLQQLAVRLCAQWKLRGHDVTLVIINKTDMFYDVPAGVHMVRLDLPPMFTLKLRRLHRLIQRMHGLHKAFDGLDADVAIVFGADVWAQIALWPGRLSTPAIMSIQIDPRTFPDAIPWNPWSKQAEHKVDVIVALTENTRQFYRERSDVTVHVIPNMVYPAPNAATERAEGQRIISHGRLHAIKGLDILVRAFAPVHAALPKSRLCVIGDGPEREPLLQLVASLGLEDAVSIKPGMQEMVDALRCSHLYALASLSDAFPLALLEAMAAGLPVIATDCDGPLTIIQDQDNGLIVPKNEVDALANAMQRVLTDGVLRSQLSRRALQTVERYYPENVMPLWDAAIQDAMLHKRAA
jgi:glycosyltransferase involved in cell wall biosynthesis